MENYTEEELLEKIKPVADAVLEVSKTMMEAFSKLAEEIGKALNPIQDAINRIAPSLLDCISVLNELEHKSNNWRKMHGLPLYRYKQLERVIEWN